MHSEFSEVLSRSHTAPSDSLIAITENFIHNQESYVETYLRTESAEGRLFIDVDELQRIITLQHTGDAHATITAQLLAGGYRPLGYQLHIPIGDRVAVVN